MRYVEEIHLGMAFDFKCLSLYFSLEFARPKALQLKLLLILGIFLYFSKLGHFLTEKWAALIRSLGLLSPKLDSINHHSITRWT